jgi:hypothetical protein
MGHMKEIEENRREKRNKARDQNRPCFNESSSSPEYEALTLGQDDDDYHDGWSDEEENEKPRQTRRRKLNESLDYVVQRDAWQQDQKKARRKIFSKNRRGSPVDQRPSQGGRRFLKDLSHYQSNNSLKSVDRDSSTEIFKSPKKCAVRNFYTANQPQIARLSDIYVQTIKSSVEPEPKEPEKSPEKENSSWKDLKHAVLGIGLAFVVFIYLFHMKN